MMALKEVAASTDRTSVQANGDVSRYEELAAEIEAIASRGAPPELLDNEPLRKRLLKAVTAAVPELEVQDDSVHRILNTPLELMGAHIGTNMGLFVKLVESDRPLTTMEVASSLGGDPALIQRILKYIASTNLIKEVDIATWAPSRLTHVFAKRAIAAGVFHNHESLGGTWLKFPSWLQKVNYVIPPRLRDTPFSSGNGVEQTVFEWFAEHPHNGNEFNMWMTEQRFGDHHWLDTLPFESIVLKGASHDQPLFVDVGGGVGHQVQALVEHYPKLPGKLILQDQASVLESALKVPGMETQAVDFFKEQPVKGARVYYLRNVLHDWTDKDCIKILSHIKDAMAPNSLLFIDEMVVPMKNATKVSMQVDMIMLGVCTSEERSEDRWKEVLAAAGFKIDALYPYEPDNGDSLIVAVPA